MIPLMLCISDAFFPFSIPLPSPLASSLIPASSQETILPSLCPRVSRDLIDQTYLREPMPLLCGHKMLGSIRNAERNHCIKSRHQLHTCSTNMPQEYHLLAEFGEVRRVLANSSCCSTAHKTLLRSTTRYTASIFSGMMVIVHNTCNTTESIE